MTDYIDVETAQPLEFLWQPKRYKVAYGGRDSTKSWGFAQNLIVIGHEKPTRILCTREIQKSISQSVIKLLGDTVRRMKVDEFYDVQRNAIYHTNGTEFLFAGLKHNIDNIRSLEGIDIVWVEEANNVSEESWSVLIPTIRKSGSELWISFNPKLAIDPTFVRFVAPYLDEINKNGFYEDDRIHVAKINYFDNPWLSDETRDEIEYDKSHDNDRYLHVWEGECVVHNQARIFNNWEIDDTIEPEPGTAFLFGADWGFANDPTVLVRMWVDDVNRIIYIDQEAWGIGVEIDHTPKLFDTITDSRKYTIRADSARPETISYMRRQKFKIIAAKKGPGSIEEGVVFLQSYTIKIHSRCKHTIADFTFYSYKTDKLTGDILPDIIDDNNHSIDAIRYATEPIWAKTSRNVRVMIVNSKNH